MAKTFDCVLNNNHVRDSTKISQEIRGNYYKLMFIP